jgi:CubicO group peptidase (beta-lactamase class C family)
MPDTGFVVPADQRHRLTTFYRPNETGSPVVFDTPEHSWWATPGLPGASGWLVSTIDDTGRSWRCSSAAARRVVGLSLPESVALMTTDRLTAAQLGASGLFLVDLGWGLGLATPAAGTAAPFPSGVGWDGGTGTTWRSDLATGATGILFTQRQATSPEPPPLMRDFWAGVNAATR